MSELTPESLKPMDIKIFQSKGSNKVIGILNQKNVANLLRA